MKITMSDALPSKQQVALRKAALQKSIRALRAAQSVPHPNKGANSYHWAMYRKAQKRIPKLKTAVETHRMDLAQVEREWEQYLRDAEHHEHFNQHRVQE